MATVNITVLKPDSKGIGMVLKEESSRKWRLTGRSFLIELTLFVCLTGLLVAGVKQLKDSIIWDLEAWRGCILVYVLLAGGILAKWAIDLMVFSVGSFEARRIIIRRTAAHVLVGLSKSGLGFIWVVMVLVAWLVFKPQGTGDRETDKRAVNDVTRALAGVVVGVILWMVKTLFMEWLALYFIVQRSREKIEETKEEQRDLKYICDLINLQPDATGLISSSNLGGGRPRGKTVLNDEYNAIKETRDWTPKFVTDEITEIELPILVGKEEMDDEDEEDISVERIARVTADKLFDEECRSGSTSSPSDGHRKGTNKYIIRNKELGNQTTQRLLETLEEVISPVRPLDKAGAERFRKSDFRKWVVEVYIHRLVLLRTLNGRDDVLGDLNRIVSSIVLSTILIVWLIIMGLLTTQVMLLIATQLLALNFMFSDSAKTVFEAILLVFVTQPFDVGDLVRVEDQEMVVHDMNMLSTVFKVIGGEKVICPNSALMGKNITNLYFVPDSSDTLEFNIELNTPQELIEQLDTKIREPQVSGYPRKESKNWNPEKYSFVVDEEEYGGRNTYSVVLNVYHTIRFYNGGDRTKHRNQLASEVNKYITELKIGLCKSS